MQKVTDNIFLLVLFAMVGTFILAASFVFFFVRYQRRIAQQKAFMQQAQLKHSEALLHATLLSQEEERKRIGRDLHDDVGASLSNLRMIMAQASDATQRSTSYKLLIDNIINTVRTISHTLSPPGLALFGLENTLHELFDNFKLAGTINIEFTNELDSKLDALDEQSALSIFRVMQELLNNTSKHANAKNIQVVFFEENGKHILTFKDDGRGLAPSANLKHGMGMQNIEARLRMIGAKHYFPKVEIGFFIKIELPA